MKFLLHEKGFPRDHLKGAFHTDLLPNLFQVKFCMKFKMKSAKLKWFLGITNMSQNENY
jgi:hypothetical protein